MNAKDAAWNSSWSCLPLCSRKLLIVPTLPHSLKHNFVAVSSDQSCSPKLNSERTWSPPQLPETHQQAPPNNTNGCSLLLYLPDSPLRSLQNPIVHIEIMSARAGLRFFTQRAQFQARSQFRQTAQRRAQGTAHNPAAEPLPPQSLFQRLWTSEVGIKTVHFW